MLTVSSSALGLGVALSFSVVAVMQALHSQLEEAHHLSPLLHWLRDSVLAAPIGVIVAVLVPPVARWLSSRLPSEGGIGGRVSASVTWALLGSTAFALLSVPGNELHGRLFVGSGEHGHAHAMSWLEHASRDGAAVLFVAFFFLLTISLALGPPWEWLAPRSHGRAPGARVARGPALLVLVQAALVGALFLPGAAEQPLAKQTASAGALSADCNPDRSYDVVAISVTIPYNRWGDVNPNGMVFALEQDKNAIKHWFEPLAPLPANDVAGNRRLRPRPLVLRANVGECVEVTLRNELDQTPGEDLAQGPRASIHVHGPVYNVQTSDGSRVGFNEDTTVARGETITYRWRAPDREGIYYFHDHATLAGSEADGGSISHGLYGAFVVEPAGSTWLDPVSGLPLYTGTKTQSGDLYIDAIIDPPATPAFRESIQLAQDEIPGIGLGFNYGSEPQANRVENLCPDCVGEETSLSSWPYGDPALVKLASGLGPWKPTFGDPEDDPEDCGLDRLSMPAGVPGSCWVQNVVHAYPGDPTKIRFGLAGVKETHVFHMHAHQWLAEPDDVGLAGQDPTEPDDTKKPESTTIDSQTFGPGEMFTIDILFGAGSKPRTIGDSIFHCHLYPHFAEGFWSLFRVHDVYEIGENKTPDGINVRRVLPLPDRSPPPEPTATNPGYPRFIPGQVGWRPPQPPGGVTVGGPNGNPAPRIVAGEVLTDEDTDVERAVQERYYGSETPKPGAPFKDPCPSTAREVTYNVSVIQRDLVYNEAGWHDTQGRLLVLDADVAAVMAGTKEPEPLFIRVNAGDCINFNLTNRLPNFIGGDAFLELQQTNMVGEHIHLVKFDVLGSDGATNGWNYNQAAFTKEQSEFAGPCSEAGCRIPLPSSFDANNPPAGGVGQTIHERWYADYQLRTVFTHDHHFPAVDQNRGLYGALIVEPRGMDFRDTRTGQFRQPINNAANGAPCGPKCEGEAAGALFDIIGPGPKDDFREFGLSFQDFVSLAKAGGDVRNPAGVFNPPAEPERYPDDDPGVMAINYKNAPFLLRDTKNGVPVDPAYRFSSWVFGDPKTPLLQAYARDPVRIRLIQGSQEEQHVFMLHGMRWRNEPDDPQSPFVNSKALGVSDAFNFEVPEMACGTEDDDCRGDYLYTSAATDDVYLGMWGIFRVHGKGTPSLTPLPDNVPQAQARQGVPSPSGNPPPPAPNPGDPCPAAAPRRTYDVVAFQRPLVYDRAGDHDPYGLIYALAADEQAIRNGTKKPEPLVLRANEGDCIEVTLTNKLTQAFLTHDGAADGDPRLPLEPPTGTRASLRVSLHPQLVLYDVRGSDGATVGFNKDQTVGPGASRLYRWFADDVSPGELGPTNLLCYGDIRGHRHHGLFGALIIEPKNASYHDPYTGVEIESGAAADIRVPGRADFREFTAFFQDGLNLRAAGGNEPLPDPFGHPPAPGEPAEALDAEDQGEKGFNYRTEPFSRRLGVPWGSELGSPSGVSGDALSNVFSSVVHGDPATPIFRSYAGDPVRFSVLQGADKPRQHSFQLHGHAWLMEPDDPGSTLIANQGGISVGRAVEVRTTAATHAGDYRYGSDGLFHHLSGGEWGIMRIYDAPPKAPYYAPAALRNPDDPRSLDNRPVMPLELAQVTAHVFRDSNMNAEPGPGEGPGPLTNVQLLPAGGTTPLATLTTGIDGKATFQVQRGAYDLRILTAPSDWASTTPTSYRVDVTGENARATGEFGFVKLGDATIRLFKDSNGNKERDEGEAAISGWTVTLTGGGSSRSVVANTSGVAFFDDLKPGNYSATVLATAGWTPTRTVPVPIALSEDESKVVPIGYALKAGLYAKVFNDSNGNAAQNAGESSLAGWQVTAVGPSENAPSTITRVTDANGVAFFGDLAPGTYTLTETLQPDWSCYRAWSTTTDSGATTSTSPTTCAGGNSKTTVLRDETTQTVTFANRNPNVWLTAVPFNDLNNDGVKQDKEPKLVGWKVKLYASDDTTASKTTGSDGKAVFYPRLPGTYILEMLPPPPSSDPNVIDWAGSSPEQVSLKVIAGETGTAYFGFVKLGTVGALVFDDIDKNRALGETEGVLANRNVRLWDKTFKTIIAQGATDAYGMYQFKVSAGVEYQLQVLVPTGWVSSTPLGSNGKPTDRAKVTGPSSTTSVLVLFGQYRK